MSLEVIPLFSLLAEIRRTGATSSSNDVRILRIVHENHLGLGTFQGVKSCNCFGAIPMISFTLDGLWYFVSPEGRVWIHSVLVSQSGWR
jgi:hypothetical protein